MKVSGHNTRSNLLRYNSVTECERADALVILLNAVRTSWDAMRT